MINIIKLKNLVYSYDDGTKALKDISFEIKEGKMVSIIGRNGAGKSTLFLILNGILRPDKGEVIIDNEPIKYNKKGLIKVRQKLGIVFQNPDDQLFAPTVEDDVAFGPLNLGLSMEETQKRVKESLKRVGMEGFEKRAPHHLSGGQKKRVAIAGILAMNPEIMVLDEPTSGLDPKGAFKIINLLKELNKEGITIIISTHDVDLVPIYSDYVFVMDNGKLLESGTPEEIFLNKDLIRFAGLRLPRIAHLFEILDIEDSINFSKDYPLTISQARKQINKKINKE